jgi:hypothetical protein
MSLAIIDRSKVAIWSIENGILASVEIVPKQYYRPQEDPPPQVDVEQ